MLDKFIELQCQDFGVDREKVYKNEKILVLEEQSSKLVVKIKKSDKDLGNEVDILIGNMIATYGDVFFKEGFKEGLILAQEIQKLLSEN